MFLESICCNFRKILEIGSIFIKNMFAMSGLIGIWVSTFEISSKDLVFEEISAKTNFTKKSEDFSSKTLEVVMI